jgi:hypothetical protein
MDNKKAGEHRRQEIVRQFRASGLTRKAFCEKNGIGLSTLGFWLQKERANKRPAMGAPIVPVGSVKGSELYRALRIKVKEDIVIELDLPATEQEIQAVLRSVTER